MSITPSDLVRAGSAPFTADGGTRMFELDSTPDSLDIAAGLYTIYNGGSAMAHIRLGSAVVALTDKADEVAGQFLVAPGGSIDLAVPSDVTLHGGCATSTEIYLLRRVAL